MELQQWATDRLIEYERNPRKNNHAVDAVAAAIAEFGFRVPIVAKSDGTIVDGHLRLKAARKLSLTTVPVLLADDMTETQIKAFRLSVNKMAELADWDMELLAIELQELSDVGFDLDVIGFSDDELDALLRDDAGDYVDLNADSGEARGGIANQWLTFADERLPITELEIDMLLEKLKAHIETFGTNYGFISNLIERG
jgi:ParB-like chromosome segregation protein Spo0J